MHKYLTKTSFLGKKIIYLPECHSTNDIARQLQEGGAVKSGDIVITDFQTVGRGQRGRNWMSNKGENILCTIVYAPETMPENAFDITMIISLALHDLVKPLSSRGAIKWPNDIYAGRNKLAGILIESRYRNAMPPLYFIGIGLNVNQQSWEDGIRASSIALLSGEEVDRHAVFEEMILKIEKWITNYIEKGRDSIYRDYTESLYLKDIPSDFGATWGNFKGKIEGVTNEGKLQVNIDGKLTNFASTELFFLG